MPYADKNAHILFIADYLCELDDYEQVKRVCSGHGVALGVLLGFGWDYSPNFLRRRRLRPKLEEASDSSIRDLYDFANGSK